MSIWVPPVSDMVTPCGANSVAIYFSVSHGTLSLPFVVFTVVWGLTHLTSTSLLLTLFIVVIFISPLVGWLVPLINRPPAVFIMSVTTDPSQPTRAYSVKNGLSFGKSHSFLFTIKYFWTAIVLSDCTKNLLTLYYHIKYFTKQTYNVLFIGFLIL